MSRPSPADFSKTWRGQRHIRRPATRVKVVTTPLSWVFITDHDVWKVKRPVDYGFVDYTSLWLRRHFCYEEVRLNQRLAPDVYRGVVPVYFDGERHAFGTSGRIVDYAVQMRRLPDSASADRLLERGELTRDDLSRLAQRLCALYSTARTGSVWDSVDVIRANVNGNFAQASAYIGRFVDPETFDTVKAWQLERLTRDAPSFAMRHTQDRIREGHGDLRLEHVYFEDNEPIVIDAIEFNERFRMADVAADVAFLAMDLDARSRPDLAAEFLATIARESEDYGLYRSSATSRAHTRTPPSPAGQLGCPRCRRRPRPRRRGQPNATGQRFPATPVSLVTPGSRRARPPNGGRGRSRRRTPGRGRRRYRAHSRRSSASGPWRLPRWPSP